MYSYFNFFSDENLIKVKEVKLEIYCKKNSLTRRGFIQLIVSVIMNLMKLVFHYFVAIPKTKVNCLFANSSLETEFEKYLIQIMQIYSQRKISKNFGF